MRLVHDISENMALHGCLGNIVSSGEKNTFPLFHRSAITLAAHASYQLVGTLSSVPIGR
ncbi:unnamed protein product, partial [Nesidiocoris tenuis]